jgi:hypothetical protein
MCVAADEPPEFPAPVHVEPGDPARKGEVVLQWKPEGEKAVPIFEYWEARSWPIYLLDGHESGRGPRGFLATLKALRETADGSQLRIPAEPPGIGMFPMEFRDVVAAKRFQLVYETKNDWQPINASYSAERLSHSLLRFATLIRDGAKPGKADAIVSWKQERDEQRRLKSEATYFYNDKNMGSGTQGFLAVLKQIESLLDGATVRIDPVCIRTHGPFADPVIMKGQRHFETSGEEPFRSMVDLLAELAQRKRLHIEVIPDEGPPDHCPGGK